MEIYRSGMWDEQLKEENRCFCLCLTLPLRWSTFGMVSDSIERVVDKG